MAAQPARFRSFGQLARALLSDPNWPADMKLRERSLATVLSKLDREQDLTWLGDRADVQAILARLLQCSVSELVRPPSGEAELRRRKLRWADLRYAQTFDLTEDPPPPSLPAEVTDPARWERTFWVAPSGAGRSLVGQWLAARGLAHYTVASRLSEVELTSTADSPLFVELTSSQAIGPPPSRRRLCVAGAVPPASTGGWRIVRTPQVDACLPELVRWLLARLPADSALDEDSLLEYLRAGPIQSGEADGFGAVVGLVGVLDRVGLKRARGKSVLDLARLDVRRRFDEAFGAEARDVAWQRRNAVDVLLAMARRALTDDTEPFTSPRTLEEWTALVPDEHKSGVDVEWLRVSLAGVDSSIRPTDVERAARRLSPGAFRIVRALSRAGLLEPSPADRLLPAPRWISHAVELEAERQLLGSSPFEWGEALLRPHAAPRVARGLLERLRSGDTAVISDVLELEARESPAYAVAVETTFRAAGLTLLSGTELDGEPLGELWQAARELWLMLPGAPPLPRIEHPAELDVLFHRGTYLLAALAVSEVLQSKDDSVLMPWRFERPPEGFSGAYDAMAEALGRAEASEPWLLGAHALLDRLCKTLGNLNPESPHTLEAPSVVLDGVGSEKLTWQDVRLSSRAAAVLRSVWHARGNANVEPLALSLYRAWERASCPSLAGSVLEPSTDAGRAFFSHAPPELALRVLEQHVECRDALVAVLGSETWRVLSQDPPGDPELLDTLADALPDAWVQAWLAHPKLLPRVWRRHAAAARECLAQSARDGDVSRLVAVATSAPPEELDAVLELTRTREELGRLAAPARDVLRRWLHGLVRSRQHGWREAYAFLSRLEG